MLSVVVGPEDVCWRVRASAYCQDYFQITRIVVVLIVVILSLAVFKYNICEIGNSGIYYWNEHPNPIGSISENWREPIALCQLDQACTAIAEDVIGNEARNIFLSGCQAECNPLS